MRQKKSKSMECQKRSDCPVSNVLDFLGDKWTLLVLRDMLFMEKKLYKELADSPEGIPTNILADRLKRLERAGIISKQAYQNNPPRFSYHVTAKGLDLYPVLKEIIMWGVKYIPGLPHRDPAFLKEVEKRVRKQMKSGI